jgi:hypothetical protein
MKAKDLEEYRGVSIEDILKVTGLPPLTEKDTKYSLTHQRKVLLEKAKEQNILNKVKKSHPKEYSKITTISDKGVDIKSKEIVGYQPLSTTLDLNLVPHKVIRENKKIIIEVNKADIPTHVVCKPGLGYSYLVIGIFTQEKCFHSKGLYETKGDWDVNGTRIGTEFRFGFHSNVLLHILD